MRRMITPKYQVFSYPNPDPNRKRYRITPSSNVMPGGNILGRIQLLTQHRRPELLSLPVTTYSNHLFQRSAVDLRSVGVRSSIHRLHLISTASFPAPRTTEPPTPLGLSRQRARNVRAARSQSRADSKTTKRDLIWKKQHYCGASSYIVLPGLEWTTDETQPTTQTQTCTADN